MNKIWRCALCVQVLGWVLSGCGSEGDTQSREQLPPVGAPQQPGSPEPPPGTAGTALISWASPDRNTDGSVLTDLAGYKVYHGVSEGALDDVVQVQGSTSTSYTFANLHSGTHFFAVAGYNSMGVEGVMSAIGSKVVP